MRRTSRGEPGSTAQDVARDGTLLAVVGPSGVGKDALIDFARSHLGERPGLRFAKRVVTRPACVGEDHEAVSEIEFRNRAAAGAFALDWTAHGLHYALPMEVQHWVDTGCLVVANLSRAALCAADARFPRLVVVTVTADPDTIAQRLMGRGRETAEGQQKRLLRQVDSLPTTGVAFNIDNTGPLHEAGTKFVELIAAHLRH